MDLLGPQMAKPSFKELVGGETLGRFYCTSLDSTCAKDDVVLAEQTNL